MDPGPGYTRRCVLEVFLGQTFTLAPSKACVCPEGPWRGAAFFMQPAATVYLSS